MEEARREREEMYQNLIDQDQLEFLGQERNPNWKDPRNVAIEENERAKELKLNPIDYDAIDDIEQQILMKKQLAQTFNKLTTPKDNMTPRVLARTFGVAADRKGGRSAYAIRKIRIEHPFQK